MNEPTRRPEIIEIVEVEVKMALDDVADIPSTFANYVQLHANGEEVNLIFCVKANTLGVKGSTEAFPKASVFMTLPHAKRLGDLLVAHTAPLLAHVDEAIREGRLKR